MNTLKDNINFLRDRVMHLWHAHAPENNDEIAQEQTEEEEHVDPFMNPVLGVYVIRHSLGRRPRRA